MHLLGTLTFTSLLTATLTAQTPTVTLQTRADYGVVAEDQDHELVDGLPANTALTARTRLAASIPGAQVRCTLRPAQGRFGQGVVVEEEGSVFNRSTEGTRIAGTLDEAGPLHSTPHTLSLIVANSTATEGTLTVVWSGRASDGADATCSLDLDDDTVPDFTGAANERPVVRELRVGRVGRRFVIHITTEAEAELDGRGFAAYGARLEVYFREGAPTCSVTPYGSECGGHLDGTITDRTASLALSNAAANSFGLLVLGASEASIGIGTCALLTLPHAVLPLRTDGNGAATRDLRLPPAGVVDLRVQAVLFDGAVTTSNGLRLECR